MDFEITEQLQQVLVEHITRSENGIAVFVCRQYRSATFRSFEVDLVDGRWLLMTEQVNTGGQVVLVCNDITRSKKTEHALRDAQEEELEQETLDAISPGVSLLVFSRCSRAHA